MRGSLTKMRFAFWNKQDYRLSYLQENIELVIYSALCLFVPFFIGHPQIVVGVLVNASLIMAALNLKKYKLLPVIVLPSIGVLSRGLIFGPFTHFLLIMIPFIWIGNSILVFAFKKIAVHKRKNKWITLLIGSIAKAAFLFLAAFTLFKFGVLPKVFLTAMGPIQLGTAVGGGIIALTGHAIKKKINRTKYL